MVFPSILPHGPTQCALAYLNRNFGKYEWISFEGLLTLKNLGFSILQSEFNSV